MGELKLFQHNGKINEIIAQEEGIAMASEAMITVSKDEIEQARKLSELKYELDVQSIISWSNKEAKAEGHAEGQKNERQLVLDLIASGKTVQEIEAILKEEQNKL